MSKPARIRVAAAQFGVTEDVQANLRTCLRMINQAAQCRPDVIVLPEFVNHIAWYRNSSHCYEVAVSLGDAFLDTRSTLSPIAVCGLLPFADFKAIVEPVMLQYVRKWVELVQTAQPIAPEKRAALRQRDEILRRTIVEQDPANILADRMLGVPMRERLVRILHAAERE